MSAPYSHQAPPMLYFPMPYPGFAPPGFPPPMGGFPPPPPPNGFKPPMSLPPPHPIDEKMHHKLLMAGLVNRITNVWVGKISPVVEDETVKRLLEVCGIVSNWARVEKDGELKSFGFCKFASAEGALRALRVLDGVQLGDDQLQLKVDQKTKEELAEYERKKKVFLEKELAEQKQTGSTAPIPFSDSDEQDQRAKEAIGIIIALVDKALEGNGEGEGVVSKEIRNYRERQARLEREKRERELEAERKRREYEEEEVKREKRRKEREEREYKDKELDWYDHERARQREKRRIEEDLAEKRYRRRQLLLDDDEDDKTRRREIKSSSRRRDRLRERDEDRHFKLKELHEQELRRKEQLKLEEERKAREAALAKLSPVTETPQSRPEVTRKPGEAIGQFKEEVLSTPEKQAPVSGIKVALSVAPTNKRSSTTAELFKVEQEEEKEPAEQIVVKKRKLITLDGNEPSRSPENEPIKMEPISDATTTETTAPVETKPEPVTPQSEARLKAQAIVDRIPKEKAELFSYTIDWALIDKMSIVEEKMRPWVKKKIVEFLGEEEATIIDYICKKLSEHVSPEELLSLFAYVFEDEAVDFVIRLWRMLIYNLLMIKCE